MNHGGRSKATNSHPFLPQASGERGRYRGLKTHVDFPTAILSGIIVIVVITFTLRPCAGCPAYGNHIVSQKSAASQPEKGAGPGVSPGPVEGAAPAGPAGLLTRLVAFLRSSYTV